MASEYDETDFVDTEFQASRKAAYMRSSEPSPPPGSGQPGRPPSREELELKMTETQQRLTALKQAQEQLERERAALEEARRRRAELQMGREEMLQHLNRGLGLLEKAEFEARRGAEQMAKTMADFREALAKVEAIKEETWTQETWNVELTRALTAIENARMEWNSARLKFPLLEGAGAAGESGQGSAKPAPPWPQEQEFLRLCRTGLALTWPLAAVALIALGVFAIILLRH